MSKIKRFMCGQVVRVLESIVPSLLDGKECLVRNEGDGDVTCAEPQDADYPYKLYRPSYPSEHAHAMETRVFLAFQQDGNTQKKFFERDLIATGHFLDQDRGAYDWSQHFFLSSLGYIVRVEDQEGIEPGTGCSLGVNAQGEIVDSKKQQPAETYDETLDLPLCVAVREEDWPKIHELIDAGADCTEISRYGYSALAYALAKDPDLSFLKYFLKDSIDLTAACAEYGILTRKPLEFAAANKYLTSMRWLLDHAAQLDPEALNVDTCLFSILERIAEDPQIPTAAVKLLLERGATLLPKPGDFYCNFSALSLAMCCKVQLKTVELLLEFGADPNYRAEWMGDFGSGKEEIDYLELFLKFGVDINQVEPQQGETALIRAVRCRHMRAFDKLIGLGAKVNVEDFSGATPIYHALLTTEEYFFEQLIAHGADINYENCWGSTPLMVAARNGFVDKAKRLLELGANLELKDQWGATALIAAVRPGYKDMVEYLLSKGADHRIRNVEGETAYSYALMYEHSEIAEMLLEHHKETSPSRFKVGETACSVAFGCGPVRVEAITLDRLGCHYVYRVSATEYVRGDCAPSGWRYPRSFDELEYAMTPPLTDK